MWIADKSTAALQTNFNSPDGAGYTTWANAVAEALPGVSGVTANAPTVAVDANNQATITVYWQAPDEGTSHNYAVIARINQ